MKDFTYVMPTQDMGRVEINPFYEHGLVRIIADGIDDVVLEPAQARIFANLLLAAADQADLCAMPIDTARTVGEQALRSEMGRVDRLILEMKATDNLQVHAKLLAETEEALRPIKEMVDAAKQAVKPFDDLTQSDKAAKTTAEKATEASFDLRRSAKTR